MLDDLRDGHQHARGGSAFRRERSEIDRDRVDVVERAVDGGEERSAPGRLGRLAFNPDGPAHGIVELGRVQAEMRQRDRDAMSDASGLGEAERHAEIIFSRLGQRAIERGDEPGCVRQGRLAFLNDDEGKITQSFKGRLGGKRRRFRQLPFDGRARGLDDPARLGRGRMLGQLRQNAGELAALRFESVAKRIPPADVGPPIRVASDPGSERDGTRSQLRPSIPPEPAARREKRAVERVDRISGMQDGEARLLELVLQADSRVGPERGDGGVASVTGLHAPRSHLRDRAGHAPAHAEGRVRGENRRKPGTLDLVPEPLEAGRIRVGSSGDPLGQRHEGFGDVAVEADIAAQAPRSVMDCFPTDMLDQRGEIVLIDVAAVQSARQGQGDEEDRVAERVLRGLVPSRLDGRSELVCERFRTRPPQRLVPKIVHRLGSSKAVPGKLYASFG
ncbi:MAG TPA: hypothetical protein VFY72_01505 [Beijerinckiaceae bacterium]|nr:hypothetical protein [Beijerinckiaceae bacterium]